MFNQTTYGLRTTVVVVMCLTAALAVLAPTEATTDGIWTKYLNSNNVTNIAIRGDNIWAATDGGLIRWNRLNGSYECLTRDQGLPSNRIYTVAMDGNGSPWFSVDDEDLKSGVTCYDNGSIVTYDSSNSALPNNRVQSIFFDSKNQWWAGTAWGGVNRFDGSEWTTYFPDEVLKTPRKIAVGDAGIVWLGSSNGLWRFDGSGWTQFTTLDGLSGNSILDITYDSRGVLWIATTNGVTSFDGVTWRTFTNADGLVNNYVNTILVDTNDVKWIGTDHGVSRFDGTVWTTYTEKEELIDNKVTGIVEDTGGVIWFSHDDVEKGVTAFDGDEWEWFTIYNKPRLPSNNVNAVAADSDGAVWFATDKGIVRYAKIGGVESWDVFDLEGVDPGKRIQDIIVDSDGVKWIVFDRYEKSGVLRFDGIAWELYTTESGLESDAVLTLTVGKKGTLYFGTTRGLSIFDGVSWSHHPGNDRLISPNIFDMAEDGDGTMWFATSGGLSRFDGSSWRTFYTSEPVYDDIVEIAVDGNGTIWCLSSQGNLMSLINDSFVIHAVEVEGISPEPRIHISSFALGADGMLWADTNLEMRYNETEELWEKDLISFDGAEWKLHTLSTAEWFSEGRDIAIDDDNVLWLATDVGLRSFDGTVSTTSIINGPVSNNIRDIAIDTRNNIMLATDRGLSPYNGAVWESWFGTTIRSIVYDENNILWLSDQGGIVTYDGNEWTLFDHINDKPIYPSLNYARDENNVMWAGTTWGLWKVNGSEWTFYGEDEGFLDGAITDIQIEPTGVLWMSVGIRKGLWRFDGETFTRYLRIDGISDDTADALVIDKNNRKWVGTRLGLSCFNDTTWTTYTVANGLPSNQVNALAVDHNNILWVGTDNGVARFDGESWLAFNDNDGLVDNEVSTIEVDYNNIKWFGTTHGLASYDDRTSYTTISKPKTIDLKGNFPNPFNVETTIEFYLNSWGTVIIDIYNIGGQKVRSLIFKNMPAGRKNVIWNGRGNNGEKVSSGAYFYRITKGSHKAAGRMMLIK